jgi:hypothetical protein
MNAQRPDIEALLVQVEAGRLDDLSVEQIAALEAALDESPALAERMAGLRPPADACLQSAARMPSAADWSRVWNAIDSSFASQRAERPARVGRIYTLGRAAAAIAACVALVVAWRTLLVSTPDNSAGWALAVSSNTEILELEVFDGRSATLDFAGDGSGVVVISIGDPDDSETGA